MKTLDEIINNENYERLNWALVERSVELAEKIREAMRSAEITEIGDYSIRIVRSGRCGYSDTSLYVVAKVGNEWGCELEHRNLETTESKYFCGDFDCWIDAAKGKDRLKFLNDAKSILEKIESIKQKRMKEVENALNAVDGL